MNEERVRFYNDFLKYGLGLEVLGAIPGRVLEIKPYGKDCFQINTSKQPFLLWIHQGREESLADQLQLIRHCGQNGFEGFLEPIGLKNGRVYGKLDDRRWFYLTQQPQLGSFFYSNSDHLILAVKLIADFRRCSSAWPLPHYWRETGEKSDLSDQWMEMMKLLEAFAMLAKHRIEPSRFDQMFLEQMPLLREDTTRAKEFLSCSAFERRDGVLSSRGIVLNDLSRNNLRIDAFSHLKYLQVKHFRCELPILDLALLMVKSGRSNGWSRQWFEALCQEYRKFYPVEEEELKVIRAYLTFPWNVYRLAARYYLNRVEWPLHIFVGKMERVLNDEPNRLELLRELG